MLKDKKLLSESDLFEDLNQQESETIKGGVTITAGCTTPISRLNIDEECEDNTLYTAPEKYYINTQPEFTKLTTTGSADQKKECAVDYSGYVELLPGVQFPRSVNLRAKAIHDDFFGGRGNISCQFDFNIFTVG